MSETATKVETAQPEFERLSDVARRLNCAPSTVVAAIGRGQLRGLRVGARGVWRVERKSVEKLIDEGSRR